MRRAALLLLAGAMGPAAAAQRPDVPAVPPALARLVPPSPAPAGFIADVPDVIPAEAIRSSIQLARCFRSIGPK